MARQPNSGGIGKPVTLLDQYSPNYTKKNFSGDPTYQLINPLWNGSHIMLGMSLTQKDDP